MTSPSDLERAVAAYVLGALSPQDASRVRDRLAKDPAARALERQMRQTLGALGAWRDAHADLPAPAIPAARPDALRRPPRRRLLLAAAAAAAFLGAAIGWLATRRAETPRPGASTSPDVARTPHPKPARGAGTGRETPAPGATADRIGGHASGGPTGGGSGSKGAAPVPLPMPSPAAGATPPPDLFGAGGKAPPAVAERTGPPRDIPAGASTPEDSGTGGTHSPTVAEGARPPRDVPTGAPSAVTQGGGLIAGGPAGGSHGADPGVAGGPEGGAPPDSAVPAPAAPDVAKDLAWIGAGRIEIPKGFWAYEPVAPSGGARFGGPPGTGAAGGSLDGGPLRGGPAGGGQPKGGSGKAGAGAPGDSPVGAPPPGGAAVGGGGGAQWTSKPSAGAAVPRDLAAFARQFNFDARVPESLPGAWRLARALPAGKDRLAIDYKSGSRTATVYVSASAGPDAAPEEIRVGSRHLAAARRRGLLVAFDRAAFPASQWAALIDAFAGEQGQ